MSSPDATFVKRTASARAAAWEAAGLNWLRVDGGTRVVGLLAVAAQSLALQRLSQVAPSAADAEAFGRLLAATHAAGASAYGVGPAGWDADGYQGPADDLLPLPLAPYDSWGAMYADLRLAPLVERLTSMTGRRRSGPEQAYRDPARSDAERLLHRLRSGEFDDTCSAPARLHGDLWSGNVVWTAGGAVLIDPAAHGGHPESDLAALTLFGAPHLERILAAYHEIAPLTDGWHDRQPLMQLHLVLLHAVLFGGGYVEQARSIMRRY